MARYGGKVSLPTPGAWLVTANYAGPSGTGKALFTPMVKCPMVKSLLRRISPKAQSPRLEHTRESRYSSGLVRRLGDVGLLRAGGSEPVVHPGVRRSLRAGRRFTASSKGLGRSVWSRRSGPSSPYVAGGLLPGRSNRTRVRPHRSRSTVTSYASRSSGAVNRFGHVL
jgi:hypothetical protein